MNGATVRYAPSLRHFIGGVTKSIKAMLPRDKSQEHAMIVAGWRQVASPVAPPNAAPEGPAPDGGIREWIQEAGSITKELRTLSCRRRKLTKRKTYLERHISYFIGESGYPGVKSNGTAAVRTEKVVRKRGRKADRERAAQAVLEDIGLKPELAGPAVEAILEAIRGVPEVRPSVRLTPY